MARHGILLFLLLLLTSSWSQQCQAQSSQRNVIIDADTANEVDDLYAVVRGLIEPSWSVLALNATQWQVSQWASPETMEDSHRLNQLLLGHLQLNTPTKRGGHRRMYDWGDKAVHSAAAYEIIKQAKLHSSTDKLTVVALGALTNVASALFISPEIAENIEVFWLGSTYDIDEGTFGVTDFNSIMDIQAVFEVLDSSVELTVIPVNVASKMTFTFDDITTKLKGQNPLADFLVNRWTNHIDGGRKSRTLWDLALITTMIYPQWAQIEAVELPKSFGSKKVKMYHSFNANKVRQEFYKSFSAIDIK
uniref:nucleoside hydrolase n=1 Tax=Shewanella gaetbuli TaxID=220752 RepID=UPI003B5BFD28